MRTASVAQSKTEASCEAVSHAIQKVRAAGTTAESALETNASPAAVPISSLSASASYEYDPSSAANAIAAEPPATRTLPTSMT